MKSKFNAFRNHMVYVNCKNSNLKKMSYSIQNGFQCIWAPKNDQEEENMALDILKNNHVVLLCTQTRRKQKIKLCTFWPSVTCPSVTMTPSLYEVTAHCVCSIYTTNFYCFERNGSPFFQHKNSSPIFINFDRMYL